MTDYVDEGSTELEIVVENRTPIPPLYVVNGIADLEMFEAHAARTYDRRVWDGYEMVDRHAQERDFKLQDNALRHAEQIQSCFEREFEEAWEEVLAQHIADGWTTSDNLMALWKADLTHRWQEEPWLRHRDMTEERYLQWRGVLARKYIADIEAWIERRKKDEKRSRHLTAADIKKLQPPEWLIQDIVIRNSTARVTGKWGSGKTFVALHWAFSLQEPVVYVVGEGLATLRPRIEAWEQYYQGDTSLVHFHDGPVNLTKTGEVRDFIEEWVQEYRPSLIIFDTQSRCSEGADENSATEMNKVVGNLDRIRRVCGATTMLLHHPGLQGDRARGSSVLAGALDTEAELKPEAKLASAEGVPLVLDVTKQKGAKEAKIRVFQREVMIGDTGITSCVIEAVETEVRLVRTSPDNSKTAGLDGVIQICKVLRKVEPASSGEWEKETGLPSATFQKRRGKAQELGLVSVEPIGNKHLYRTTDKVPE